MKHNYNSLSIKKKFWLYTTIFVAMYIFTITLISQLIFGRMTSSRSIASFNERLTEVKANCEAMASQAQQLSYLLLTDEDIQNFMGLNSSTGYAQRLKCKIAVEKRFNYVDSMKLDSQFTSIAVYNHELGIGAYTNNLRKQEEKHTQYYIEQFSQTNEALWAYPKSTQFDTYLCYVRPFFDFRNGSCIGHIIINYNKDFIKNLFNNFSSVSGQNYTILYKGHIILSSESLNSTFNNKICNNFDDIGSIADYKDGYWYTYSGIDSLGLTIVAFTPNKVLMQDTRTMTFIIIGIGLGFMLMAVFFSRFVADTITTPIVRLSETMRAFGGGNREIKVEFTRQDEIGILEKTFNDMVIKINDLFEKIYYEQRAKRKFEFNALQAQINPHFLYNTLNSICSLIVIKDTKNAYKMINNLSMFYRSTLSKGSTLVPIKDEIINAENYIHIQKIRLRDKFDYSIEVDPVILDKQIVKLTLQPLIENALNHGIQPKTGKGTVSIIGKISNRDVITFIVSDDGIGIHPKKIQSIFNSSLDSFGIFSVRERLRLYFNGKADMKVESEVNEGTVVTVSLPSIPATVENKND